MTTGLVYRTKVELKGLLVTVLSTETVKMSCPPMPGTDTHNASVSATAMVQLAITYTAPVSDVPDKYRIAKGVPTGPKSRPLTRS